MTRTRLALLLTVLGVLTGAIGALTLPRSGAAEPGPPLLKVERTAPASRLDPTRGLGIDVLPGTQRKLLRAPDPAGGPVWALETLRGRYRLPSGVPREQIGKELFGRRTCLRLGRIVDGRFGWLDGRGTFRPSSPANADLPIRCHRDGDRSVPAFQQTSWVSHPTFGPAVLLARVVWGPAQAAASVRASGGGKLPVTNAPGAFLAFAPVGGKPPVIEVASGGMNVPEDDFGPRASSLPGTTSLGAQAPDPEGGAPYGVSVGRRADGRWCFGNAGRVVDGRVGDIDPRLDTFLDETAFAYQCGPDHVIKAKYRVLTRARPLAYSFGGGGPAGPASSGRVALRTLPQTTVFAGITRADVRTIRVRAPTQTRVLRPSGPAHAFVLPLNGTFPTGRVSFEITFTDGTVVAQSEDPSL